MKPLFVGLSVIWSRCVIADVNAAIVIIVDVSGKIAIVATQIYVCLFEKWRMNSKDFINLNFHLCRRIMATNPSCTHGGL